MRNLCLATLLALTGAVCSPHAAAQGSRAALSLGAGLHPLGSAAPIVQAEFLLSDRLSLGARLIGLEYTYEEDRYTETGDGRGFELLATWYFRNAGHEGPYVSAGLGHFAVDWDWRDPGASGARSGFGRTRGAAASASLGWKWPIGRSLYLDPAVTVGHFFGTAKDNTGSRESELGTYAAVTLKLGWRF